MDQKELEKRIAKLMRIRRLFVILSFSFLGSAIACDLVSTILNFTLEGFSTSLMFYLLIEISALFFAASIALFFVRVFAIDTKIRNALYQLSTIVNPINNGDKVDLGTTDVKEVKLDRPHELVKQYEDLMKQGLITPEDYEKKRKEILGE